MEIAKTDEAQVEEKAAVNVPQEAYAAQVAEKEVTSDRDEMETAPVV